jgi:glutamate synthase domain-containing protein 2
MKDLGQLSVINIPLQCLVMAMSSIKKCVLGLNTKVKLIEANHIQKFSVKAITKYFSIVNTQIYETLKRKSSNVLVQVVQQKQNCELEIKTIMKLW